MYIKIVCKLIKVNYLKVTREKKIIKIQKQPPSETCSDKKMLIDEILIKIPKQQLLKSHREREKEREILIYTNFRSYLLKDH